jgi:cytidyltransferase-like protein
MTNPIDKVVVASLYGDPLHSGHIEYLQLARQLGTSLIVIVNNDEQTIKKKGFVLLSAKERIAIVRELKCVTTVVESIDKDESVCQTLKMLHPHIFAKGGDRNRYNIPEKQICEEMGIQITDGCGIKKQSSRKLLCTLQSDMKNVTQGYFEGN